MTSIVFMGTPQFSVPILESLIEHNYDVLAVVTQPDRKVGRKHVLTAPPVKQAALKHDIEILQPEKINHSPEMDRVIELNPDLIVTAAFGQFLPTKLLAAAKIAAVNVHASLLPKYRGGAPVHYSVINGDEQTGVSIIYMVKKMDAGDILSQRAIKIEKTDDTGNMFDKLSLLGRDLLLETLPELLNGTNQAVAQTESEVTFSPNISSVEERIDINKTAGQIDDQVRGMRPFPISNMLMDNVVTKIIDVTPLTETTELKPGQIVQIGKKELIVAAGDGTTFKINQLKPAGKPLMNIVDYLNGHHDLAQGGQLITND